MKRTKGEKIFDIANGIFMILFCMAMLYPILYVVSRSMMPAVERAANPLSIIPRSLDFSAYKYILSSGSLLINSYKITILRTVVGTLFNIFFTSMFAYVLSRKDYPLRTILTALVIFTMWFNGGLIPNFLLIRSLGMINSFWVFVIPLLINPWNMLILRNFFMQIPQSLIESAKIDGANEIQILWKIIRPLSTPALATISLFYAVWHWNAWFDALIYINDRALWPIQMILRQAISSATAVTSSTDIGDIAAMADKVPPAQSVIMATIVVATVPILCVYPFLQKYFVKGVMLGSLKG